MKYKINKHDYLQKCGAKLIVCEDQQNLNDLPTRATTLAIIFLHILLALNNKFNIKIVQLDIIKVFVYKKLGEMVFMHMFPKYSKNRKILYLEKALYNLQWFPLLW